MSGEPRNHPAFADHLGVLVEVTDLHRHPVDKRVGDRLVGHAEGRVECLALIKDALRLHLRWPAGHDIEVGREDADQVLARTLLGFLDRLLELGRHRSHHRIDAILEERGQDLGHAVAVLICLDELVLCRTGVRVAQEPVRSNEKPGQRHAANHRTWKYRHS